MGTFCESCQNKENNNNNNEDSTTPKCSKNDTLSDTILLPKQCIDDVIQNEKPKNIGNNNDIINNKNKINKNFAKSKTIIINDNNIKSSKVINRTISKISKKIKKLNSLKISDEKKQKLINDEINLLEKKLSKPKRKLSKSEIGPRNKKVSKMPVFTRRKKKSTTLMENKNVINQLRKIQMSIPLFQESLVQQQKGNPSDKYIIGKKIGAGSYGTVYEATNIIFKSKVAMKMIIKRENMKPEYIKNEIDILKKLSHPNIVKIYEFYESTNCFYLINEFCDQGELYNYINKSTLNEQQLSIIFYQVFSGLCYLHENNILHRDIKPENILISKKEQDLKTNEEYFWIKIIDFGTAKIFERGEKEKRIVGSAYYIAPEVLDQNYNEKCDTWSVGVILYMFLVGRAPFDGYNNEEIINSIRTKNYDENNPKLLERSAEVRDLINNLLNKNIEQRYSAKEALNHGWFKKFNGRKLFANFCKNDIEPFINNIFNYILLSKIQQLVIAFLVHNMPMSDKFGNILKIYRHFNELGDCKLTKEELIKGLSNYRDENEVKQKVDILFISLDGDNNGYIEFEEFLRACVDKKEILNENNLKYAFKFLDHNGSGKLNSQKILYAFMNDEYNKDKKFEIAIEKDISEVDGDGDGEINFDEFKMLIFSNLI